jgi:glycosyltransferase involved in cell wall biosynthesis
MALSLNPNDPALGNLLLDLHYDGTVAETILAKDRLVATERARFGAPIAPPAPVNGFIIDNEIPLQRQLVATNKVAMQGYFDLLKKELVVEERQLPTTRWAARVLGFSTEYNPSPGNWSAAQTLGTPDSYPDYGDIVTAWAGASPDDQRELLELGYEQPVPITAVSIYETWNPGAADKISVRNSISGQWQEVWSGVAGVTGQASRVFAVKFPTTPFQVDAIRIDINSPAVPGWNEIDAVSLSGPGPSIFTTDSGFGHRLFQTLVPQRGLAPATYTNASGQNVLVTTNSLSLTNGLLFTGYKNLVLLFDVLRAHGRNAATLARLLASRRNAGDLSEVQTVTGDTQQFLFLHGTLLSHYWDAGVAGQHLSEALDVPHVHTPHSLGVWKKRRMENDYPGDAAKFEKQYNFTERIRRERELYTDADLVVATTPQQLDLLKQDYEAPADNCRMIPPGYDDNRFFPVGDGSRSAIRQRLGFSGKVVMAIGRIARNKGYDRNLPGNEL